MFRCNHGSRRIFALFHHSGRLGQRKSAWQARPRPCQVRV